LKIRKSLEKYFDTKHPGNDIPRRTEFLLGNKTAPKVHPCLLKKSDHYLEWPTETAECIDFTHNPSVSGKYLKFAAQFKG